jgi:hypothetical protein
LLVGYDLNRPGQNYPELFAQLRAFPGWWHCLDSTWLVRATLTAEQLRNQLRPHVDPNDELLVLDVSGDAWAWVGFDQQCGSWFATNMSATAVSAV